jgi:hypothetical protein
MNMLPKWLGDWRATLPEQQYVYTALSNTLLTRGNPLDLSSFPPFSYIDHFVHHRKAACECLALFLKSANQSSQANLITLKADAIKLVTLVRIFRLLLLLIYFLFAFSNLVLFFTCSSLTALLLVADLVK